MSRDPTTRTIPHREARPVKKPRPIFLAIWYPAAALHDTAMVYRDYFRAVSVDSPVADFAQRLRKFTRDMACQYMLGKEFEKLTSEERADWDALLATPVFATQDVPAARGKISGRDLPSRLGRHLRRQRRGLRIPGQPRIRRRQQRL